VRLVREAAFDGDLAQRPPCREHEPLGALYATPHYVSVRRLADTSTEGDVEVRWAETCESREMPVSDGRAQVCFDVCENSA
jgi:hypothetical protein